MSLKNNLINISKCTSEKDLEYQLALVSKDILYKYKLVYGASEYKITAIEFYLSISKNTCGFSFIDPFTHTNEEQLNTGTFYIHDDCKRACNYSGIDITCGDKENGIYGGILIRELEHNDGSATAVKSIIRNQRKPVYDKKDKWSAEEKEKLYQIHRSDILTGPLKLVETNSVISELYRGKRILGISEKKAKERGEVAFSFFNKPLRYSTWKTKKHIKSMEKIDI